MNGTAPAPPDLGAPFKNGELPAGHGLTWAGWAKRGGFNAFWPAGILLAFGIHQLLTASIPTGIGMIGAALALGLALMVSDMRKRFRRVYVMRAGPSRPERRTYASLATGNHAQPLRPDAGAEAAYRGPALDRAQQGILLASIHERTGEIADNEAEAKAGTSAVNASFVSALYVVLVLVAIITVAAMGPDIVATLGELY